MILSDRAQFDLARRLRSREGATLGEVFTFLSGLYFRGKLAYANAFACAANGLCGVLVITPTRGLVDATTKAEAEVFFYHFGPGDAGGTRANVERWFRQFVEPREKINAKTEDITVGKHKVTYVSAEGTYKSGMPGGPQTPMPNYALIGAIIEADEGSVFVKMTGPKELTKSATADFKKMVESAVK